MKITIIVVYLDKIMLQKIQQTHLQIKKEEIDLRSLEIILILHQIPPKQDTFHQ